MTGCCCNKSALMLTGSCESALTLCILVPSFVWIRRSIRSGTLQSAFMPFEKTEIYLLFKIYANSLRPFLHSLLHHWRIRTTLFPPNTSETLRLKKFGFLLRQVLILEFVLIWIQLKITQFICLYSSDEGIRGTRYDWCAYTCLIEVMGCVCKRGYYFPHYRL